MISHTYKIAMFLTNGTDNVDRVTTNTRVFVVIMPNIQGIRTNSWRQFRTTVDEIETITGFDFLSNVPVNIQSVIETTVDTVVN